MNTETMYEITLLFLNVVMFKVGPPASRIFSGIAIFCFIVILVYKFNKA